MPIYERLVVAMAHDIQIGLLTPGTRLPTQRDLAFRLGISVGSVTRAYAEAERRGLLSAHVGRGTFVCCPLPTVPDVPTIERGTTFMPNSNRPVDLRCNTVPPVPLMAELKAALGELMARGALDPAMHYVQGSGLPKVREAGARWISRHYGLDFHAGNLIQCNGGQHGIALVFSSLCAPGDSILCEASTFYGARMAATHLGLKLHGLPMDDEGLLPEAVKRAAQETGSRLLFTLPTLHNPTTRTMSDQRRKEIATVAREHNLIILEDDAYYAYSEHPRQIVSYAPERTIYLASLSKGICPGFRLAFLVLPCSLPQERIMRGIRAFGYCPPTLGALVFSEWVEDGRIDSISQMVQKEATARWNLAQSILGDLVACPGAARSPHAWLPMPTTEAAHISTSLLRFGVEVTPPEASEVSTEASEVSTEAAMGLRLCLGAPESQNKLQRALEIIKNVIKAYNRTDHNRVV